MDIRDRKMEKNAGVAVRTCGVSPTVKRRSKRTMRRSGTAQKEGVSTFAHEAVRVPLTEKVRKNFEK